MIGSIRGRLVDKSPPWIRVECSGVGYEIEVPMSTFYNLPEVNNEVFLLTHMVVREDAQLLYGFLTAEEKSSFKSLIKVNGIGAKVALSILSGVSIEHSSLYTSIGIYADIGVSPEYDIDIFTQSG